MSMNSTTNEASSLQISDILCFSHLRWDFVYQRPQHLMSRFSHQLRVFFIEEPIFHAAKDDYDFRQTPQGVFVITPRLNDEEKSISSIVIRQKILLTQLISKKKINNFISWYYTPMALKISSHLKPKVTVYDCMDELSAFKFAPVELKLMEAELLKKSNVVFTGGQSLYEAKKHLHQNIYAFPSSIEKKHFEQARNLISQPADQSNINGKKIGFYGVIDERFNIKLIDEVAKLRPSWQFVLIGPVVKIDQADLPVRSNIHYLGGKSYKELPSYLSGWDIAIIPFEKNESTKYISPTKTPEYLAGGKPVISSSITDVVSPYSDKGLVHIADTVEEFIQAAELEFSKSEVDYQAWLFEVDRFLKNFSWDICATSMLDHIYNYAITMPLSIENTRAIKSVA